MVPSSPKRQSPGSALILTGRSANHDGADNPALISLFITSTRKVSEYDNQHWVLVADEVFTEWGPEAEWLKARHKQPLRFAAGVQLRPSIRHLAWHREQVFSQA